MIDDILATDSQGASDDWIPDELCRTLVADRSPEGENASRWYLRACRHAIAQGFSTGSSINTESLIESDRDSIMIDFLKRV